MISQIRFCFLIINLLVCCTCFSQWNSNPTINNTIATIPKSQQNIHTVIDGKGGAIMAWDDNRNSTTNSTDIYAQRISNSGMVKWANNGIVICSNNSLQKSVSIVDAGNGSAIIAWEDARSGNYDIYAQKVDSSGNILWATDGIIVCNKATNQKNPKIISDNSGGAIIVWEDSVNFYWDVYAQRINSAGSQVWTNNGIAICAAPNLQINPKLDIDGQGGAFIVWQDKRSNIDFDIYAQHVNANGSVLWSSNGLAVCNAANVQNNPRVEPDGSNGAVITWVDKRNGLDYDIYAQRVNASGTNLWSSNGNGICTAIGNQSAVDMKFNNTGVVFSWKDERAGSGIYSIYSQLVNLSGVPQLTANGIKLSSGLKSINPNSTKDGVGGVVIVWQDSTSIGWDIKAQKINSTGSVEWTAGEITVSDATNDQINPTHVGDGNGGAIFAWEDRRNGTDYDVFAYHVFYNGNPILGIKEEMNDNPLQTTCFPNPVNETSVIRLDNYESFHQSWEITIYDTYGKLIEHQLIENKNSFELRLLKLNNGFYFYTIKLKDKSLSAKGKFMYLN